MIGNPESRGWSQIAWRPVARKGLTILLINALLVGQVPAPLWAQEALAGDVTAEASDESVPSAEVAPDVVVERVSSDATEPATAVEESKTIELSRVEMHRAGKKISADVDALLTPGDAIQAVAITGGSSADSASNGTPVTEGVSYTWSLLENEGDASGRGLGTDSVAHIPAGAEALGMYLRVDATSGTGSVSYVKGPIARAGALRLANISIAAKDGGTVDDQATLVARPVLTAGKIPPEGSVTYQWWIDRTATGSYEKIAGATKQELKLDSSMVGAKIRVTATAGGYNEVKATAGPVLGSQSAQAAIAALDRASFMPSPAYGTSDNVRKLVEDKLHELGFTHATARVVSAEAGKGDATVSAAEGEGNGDVTYYFEDLAKVDKPAGSASVKVVFEIAAGGTTATWTRYIAIRWDMARVRKSLEELAGHKLKASDLLVFEGGEAHDDSNTVEARKDLDLDPILPDWVELSWQTSDSGVIDAQGKLARKQSEDVEAELTATLRFTGATDGEQSPTVNKTFKVIVKSIATDPTVGDRLDAALGKVQLKDFGSKERIDPAAVTGDIQLPIKRDLGITARKYRLQYEVESGGDGACTVDGSRLRVTRPAPGYPDAHDTLVVTVKSGNVARTRSIDLTVKASDTADIDRELALMQQVKDGYAQALLGDNARPGAVSKDLRYFMQARLDESGNLVWARTRAEVSGTGIVPDSIDLSHPSEQWDKFKSSAPSVIESETLHMLKAPTYNTRVTITSCLKSEKYGDYYERLKDDPSISPVVLEKYRALSRQEVSATFVVRGTTGEDDPNAGKALAVSARVVGVAPETDEGVRRETWIPLTELTVEPDEAATAWDLFARILTQSGYTYSLEGGVPFSITTPGGERTLAMSSSAPWRFWKFVVNGEDAKVYPDAYQVADGDVIELVYEDDSGAVLPEQDIAIDPAAPRPDWESSWPSFTTSNKPTSSLTPVEAAEEKWVVSVGEGGSQAPGISDPILAGDYLYIASNDKLLMKDPATGETVREAQLLVPIDSTSRMVYAEGLIVVPLGGGRLQALTADTLTTVWVTQPVTSASGDSRPQQSLGTLTVRDGYVYTGTTDGSYDGSGSGYLMCVNLQTGAVRWQHEAKGGYYWAGACAFGDYLVVGDDAGLVYAFDPATGETVGTPFSAGAQVRSTVVTDGSYLYVADYKGTLHKLSMSADGSICEVASVTFGKYNTSTPAIVDGKIVLCGQSATQGPSKYMKHAAVFVIDAETMRVEREVCKLTNGGALPTMYSQSSPLVSVQDDGAYVYFTVNWKPSSLYRYRIGDEAVDELYTPSDANQEYCLNSVIAGPDGSLYYKNDSGKLFALKGAPSWTVTIEPNNGARRTKVYVKRGAKLPVPVEPVREGYTFEGWFVDEQLTRPWDADEAIAGDTTLYAKWSKVEQPGGGSDGDGGTTAPDGDDGTAPEVIPPSDQGESAGQQAGGSQERPTTGPQHAAPQAGGTAKPAEGPSKTAAAKSANAHGKSTEDEGASDRAGDERSEGDAEPAAMPLGAARASSVMERVMATAGVVGVVGVAAAGGWLAVSAFRRRR